MLARIKKMIRSTRYEVRGARFLRSTPRTPHPVPRTVMPILLFSVLFSIFSCTERIEMQLRPGDVRLVVDGGISFDIKAHQVVISTTMSFFSSNDDIPYVSDAHVTITEFDQNMVETGRVFLLTEHPYRKGHYFTNPDVYGKQRHTYRLTIALKESIGGHQIYTADAHFPPIAERIDSIRAIWGQNQLMLLLTGRAPDSTRRWTGWNVEVFADDTDDENYYALILYKNGIPLNDTLTRFLLLDNQMVDQNSIGLRGLPMAFISDSSWMRAREGDEITLEIRGVSADYYRFLFEFRDVHGGQNPMFGGAPANVRGNINGGAIGYFWAHGSRKASDVADRSKLSTMAWRENTNEWTPRDWLWCEPLGRWMPPALFTVFCR